MDVLRRDDDSAFKAALDLKVSGNRKQRTLKKKQVEKNLEEASGEGDRED